MRYLTWGEGGGGVPYGKCLKMRERNGRSIDECPKIAGEGYK